MIQNSRVFDEGHVPRDLEHRDEELDLLSTALEPVAWDEKAETVFLFGPSGAGKTCLTRFMIDQLEREVPEVNTAYLNCWHKYTRFGVLKPILAEFSSTVDIHRRSTPTDELLDRVQEYDGPPFVVVLDEVDQLEDKNVLYDLYRVPDLSLVLIANKEEELFAQFDERLVSRFHGSRRLLLEKYTLSQLTDILAARAKWGLAPGSIDQEELEFISDLAAGDARIGIHILRMAAREAASSGVDKITLDVIEAAEPRAKESIHRKNVDMLREDQQVLYEIIRAHGEITPGELYEQYRDRVENPKSDRTLRNYLNKMEHYNLIEVEGEKRGRTYRTKDSD